MTTNSGGQGAVAASALPSNDSNGRTDTAADRAKSAGKGLWVRYGDFLFKYRNAVFPLVMVATLGAFRPVYPAGQAALDIWLDLLGLALVLSGLGLRAAVVGLAYIKRGGLDKRVYAKSLVTSGLFAHCRNPLYLANLAMLAGYFVVHNNPWAYLLGGVFFISAYAAIVAAEEHFLNARFGAGYAAYCRDVPRWWIDPRGLRTTFAAMAFNWRRVVVKDYTCMATGLLTVAVIVAYQTIATRGLDGSQDSLLAIGLAIVACLIATLIVRILKKRGALSEHPSKKTVS